MIQEIEDDQSAAAALKSRAVLNGDVGQRKIRIAASTGIIFHASTVTIIAVRSVIYSILDSQVRDASRRIGVDRDVFIDCHNHVRAIAASKRSPGDYCRILP